MKIHVVEEHEEKDFASSAPDRFSSEIASQPNFNFARPFLCQVNVLGRRQENRPSYTHSLRYVGSYESNICRKVTIESQTGSTI